MVWRVDQYQIEPLVATGLMPSRHARAHECSTVHDAKRGDIFGNHPLRDTVFFDKRHPAGTTTERLETKRTSPGKRIEHTIPLNVAEDIEQRTTNPLAHRVGAVSGRHGQRSSAKTAGDQTDIHDVFFREALTLAAYQASDTVRMMSGAKSLRACAASRRVQPFL